MGDQISRQRAHYLKNKEKYTEQAKRWKKANPEKVKAIKVKSRKKLRTLVLDAYGNRCVCCGETQYEFLAIDHINGGGHKQRGSRGAAYLYNWLKKNNYPKSGFQILCHNCNLAKGFYGKCPHKNYGGPGQNN